MKVVNWNVEWATPASARSPEILSRIQHQNPEVICLTEAHAHLLDALNGHTICCKPLAGPGDNPNRRKVLLWSKHEWLDVDDCGDERLPKGRYIAGSTRTSIGQLAVIGVCIPYHNANVNVGSKDKAAWQEHGTYLDGLSSILSDKSNERLIVLGDFNQQIGQRRRPHPPYSQQVRAGLHATMNAGRPPGLTIATAGLGLRGRRAIDHIAVSGDLSATSLGTIDNLTADGGKLSDHFGVIADLYTQT